MLVAGLVDTPVSFGSHGAGGVGADRRECRESNRGRASLSRRTTRGYPGGMLAFLRKKFVGSYLALRATNRVHWRSVYACRTRSAASSLVKFT